MNKLSGITATAIAGMMLASAAHAVVSPLEGRTITGAAVASNDASAVFEYDPDLNITWLRNWNTVGLHIELPNAENWVSGLAPGGFTGWRLPSALNGDGTGPCIGYNCSGSEMGYLYYTELGNSAGGGMTNVGDFKNVQLSAYWTNTAYAPNPADEWIFYTFDGWQSLASVSGYSTEYVVAVRPRRRTRGRARASDRGDDAGRLGRAGGGIGTSAVALGPASEAQRAT